MIAVAKRTGTAHPSSTWTQSHRDMIAEMLVEGKSASQIAEKFPGKTRNAVIGIVMRDKRLSAIGLRGGTARKPAKPRAPTPAAARMPVRKIVAPTPPIVPAEPVIARENERHVAGRPLRMLGARQCRWCINDPEPRTNGHLFCGETTEFSQPYCPHHAKRAVNVRSAALSEKE